MRQNFNPETVRKSSKGQETFSKRQNHNARFILHLYENEEYHNHLEERLLHELDDINAEPDYSVIISRHAKYRRNGGKKTLADRKEECRRKLLRDHICYVLNDPGMVPRGRTVKLDVLEQNVDVFVKYLTITRKDDSIDGDLLSAKSYLGFRSSLTYLFRRYRYTTSRAFEEELKECMEGVKRFSNQCNQHGEGNIWEGDQPLTWGLYEQFNRWCYADGTSEGIFAVCFAKLTCNLACRGKNTGQICVKHMIWEDDSMSIPFAHSKDAQTGDNLVKKLPRHCYSNPLNLASDLPSAMFHFMALNPDVVCNEEESFFRGSLKAQSQRFGRYVAKMCKKHKDEIASRFGFKIEDIGVHSWRKCAHTKLNCGSTAGPSAAAACIRGGHTIGGSKDVYIAQEKASDTYCGRILQGLPEHSAEFAVSYPDFIPIEATQSITDGVSEEEYGMRQKEVNERVTSALNSIFGEENLNNIQSFIPILRVGLASHLIHYPSYDRLLDPAQPHHGKLIPDTSPLRRTTLFACPEITALKEYVRIAMPWEGHYKYFKAATGLPPHVMMFAYLKEINQNVSNIPHTLFERIENRGMLGDLSLEQITRAVEQGPRLTAIANDVAALRRIVQEGSISTGGGHSTSAARQNIRLVCEFKHGDGKYRRVPPSWTFPSLQLQNMYLYWHCGVESLKIPPMKYFQHKDIDFLGKRASTTLCECRRVMGVIDKEAMRKGVIPRDIMSQVEANSCYYSGESAISAVVPANTPTGQPRIMSRLKWPTVLRFMRMKRRT